MTFISRANFGDHVVFLYPNTKPTHWFVTFVLRDREQGIHLTSYNIVKMMNADKRDDSQALQIEINLVHFDKPQLNDRRSKRTSTKQKNKFPRSRTRQHVDHPSGSGNDADEGVELDCNNVLNLIMPPRRWKENGLTYRQKISSRLPIRSHVKKLGEQLDTCLKRFEVKEIGICLIRREIYTQCFNEIIRQTTLNCAERGFVLIKIRDHMNTIIDHNQKLFESVTAHGIRKSLLREHEKADLKRRAEQLKADNVRSRAELAKTAAAMARLEREKAVRRDADNARRANELNELKQINQEFKDHLKSMIFKT